MKVGAIHAPLTVQPQTWATDMFPINYRPEGGNKMCPDESTKNNDLKKYCDRALEVGYTHAVVIDPASVVTAAWVRFKCQYGCPDYGKTYGCPPYSPTHLETAEMLASYNRAILCHAETAFSDTFRKFTGKIHLGVVDLETELFKDGYYRALAIVGGRCRSCKECASLKGEPCVFPETVRPSMEACGIDAYQTVRNNGFSIDTLKEKGEAINLFRMILVD